MNKLASINTIFYHLFLIFQEIQNAFNSPRHNILQKFTSTQKEKLQKTNNFSQKRRKKHQETGADWQTQ